MIKNIMTIAFADKITALILYVIVAQFMFFYFAYVNEYAYLIIISSIIALTLAAYIAVRKQNTKPKPV